MVLWILWAPFQISTKTIIIFPTFQVKYAESLASLSYKLRSKLSTSSVSSTSLAIAFTLVKSTWSKSLQIPTNYTASALPQPLTIIYTCQRKIFFKNSNHFSSLPSWNTPILHNWLWIKSIYLTMVYETLHDLHSKQRI